jgi:hypothetical protein
MKNTLIKYILCGVMWLAIGQAQAQNNPYVDDKLLHFGFFVGVDLLSYHIEENDQATQMLLGSNKVCYPRVSAIGPGMQVGFISDLRLHQYVNLRFTPALHFGERTINYDTGDKASILTIPISIPLYLKWSAPRIKNYRPYVLVGGGVELECFRDKEKAVVLHEMFDAFVSAGFGCNFYFRWFKLCPEIKYQIGFLDAHVPISEAQDNGWGIGADEYFYSNSIKRMTHQRLSIVFNIE